MKACLDDYVCLVTGASRGIGRGIAIGLGERGATVYITGRTLKSAKAGEAARSLEATAAEINSRGGKAIPVLVDHSDEGQVAALFQRIQREQRGRLDVLVNNAYSAVPFLFKSLNKPFYECDDLSPGEAWDLVNNVGLRNHYVCATLATRMMLNYQQRLREQGHPEESRAGLIVNVSSTGGKIYAFSTLYGVGKCALDRMSHDMSIELRNRGARVSVVSLWPGPVRTEYILENTQTSGNKSLRLAKIFGPEASESPELSGRVVAALAAEPDADKLARSGHVILVSDVATQYGIMEVDGKPPAHVRSLRTLLFLMGSRLAPFVPSFIRIPKSVLMYLLSWRDNWTS